MHAKRGAVGKPIAGVEIKIADDGEILVRGENVTTGYFNAPEATREAFKDGWFHTGDIGELDAEGRLLIRGRKKEMIVTPEGLNVFPEDVERALNERPGVIDSAVVGAPVPGSTAERVQAVLLLAAGTDADAVVRAANATLGDHQKIRAAAVWNGPELPRTEGTRKLKRRELKNWLVSQQNLPAEGASYQPSGSKPRDVGEVLARFAPGRPLEKTTTLDELGLTSLERVELMMALEEAFQTTIEETAFTPSVTVAELEAMVAPPEWGPSSPVTSATDVRVKADATGHQREIVFPSWNRSWPVRIVRHASLPTWILPLSRIFARVTVTGLEHLRDVKGPVIFAANHQSHFDAPVILDSLPPRWRYRTAPAMMKEFFDAHFFPERHTRKEWFTNSLNYYLSSFFFFAFPLTQGSAGTRQTLRYMGELAEEGISILIFPEGRRSDGDSLQPLQPGVGMIASRLGIPVVPVRVRGLYKVLHRKARWPTVSRASCAFGPPIYLTGNDYGALAQQVRQGMDAL